VQALTGALLRDATAADIPALAELHVRTFRQTHGGGPDAATREQQWREKFASGTQLFCIVLEENGTLVGFAAGRRHHDPAAVYRGELNKIYLLRERHGRGLGRRLLVESARRFLAAGIDSMLLFGDAHSRSNGFYEKMGATRLYAENGDFHGGYGWPNLTHLVAALPALIGDTPSEPAPAEEQHLGKYILGFFAGFAGVCMTSVAFFAVPLLLVQGAPFKALAFMVLGFAGLGLIGVARKLAPHHWLQVARQSPLVRRLLGRAP
jgi:L-amino acid N-acyltransferase YncA